MLVTILPWLAAAGIMYFLWNCSWKQGYENCYRLLDKSRNDLQKDYDGKIKLLENEIGDFKFRVQNLVDLNKQKDETILKYIQDKETADTAHSELLKKNEVYDIKILAEPNYNNVDPSGIFYL